MYNAIKTIGKEIFMRLIREVHIKKCPTSGCPAVLRIRITSKFYGKKVRVRCPRCHMLCNDDIPIPAVGKE